MKGHHLWKDWLTEAAALGSPNKALHAFVRESNKIEGITRSPSRKEYGAHVALLSRSDLTVPDLCAFVAGVQPWARLRDLQGLNVRVGKHVAPPGGPEIRERLQYLLDNPIAPYEMHCEYLTLHPFLDGNGRSSRALWLYQTGPRGLGLPFLQRWYYDTLDRADGRQI